MLDVSVVLPGHSLEDWLPPPSTNLASPSSYGQKASWFCFHPDAVQVETRSSSPVKLLAMKAGQATPGTWPVGEGAHYAGSTSQVLLQMALGVADQ